VGEALSAGTVPDDAPDTGTLADGIFRRLLAGVFLGPSMTYMSFLFLGISAATALSSSPISGFGLATAAAFLSLFIASAKLGLLVTDT
jgi:hypothetical protein